MSNPKIDNRYVDGKRRPEYFAWNQMKLRCYNKNNPNYKYYGARGITVFKGWKDSFDSFLSDVGERPSEAHSLDRIDNNGNYEPGNVRWATIAEQNNNRRANRMLTHNGVTMTLTEWAKQTGINRLTITSRLKRGMSIAESLTK